MRRGLILAVAIFLDAALFVLNLWVAEGDGSRAVLSQAVYNAADLVGSVMIAWGAAVSRRPADLQHPFGYGKERFFWAFAASLVTFSLAGAGVFLEGASQAIAPHPITDPGAALLVVGITLGASVAGVLLILQELRADRRAIQSFLESSHQGMKTIFYQDLVGTAGSAFAFGGLVGFELTGNPALDGIGAAGVGLLMLLIGIVLAAESRELLVGKALGTSEVKRILALVEHDSRVRSVRGLQSMLLGPDDALLALRLNFADGLTTDEIERAIEEIGGALRIENPVLKHVVLEPEA
ncbi:MAG: cation diffusion facilitator family transporter [Thermoplasmata archaeon]